MNQRKLFGLMLRPSFFSSVAVLVLAGIILLAANWEFITGNSLFGDYFFGDEGLVTILRESSSGPSAVVDAVSAKPITYNILVLLIAALAGLIVYGVLQLGSKILVALLGDVVSVKEAGSNAKHEVEAEVGGRWGARAIVLVAWLLYLWFFVKVLLPFCILASMEGSVDLSILYGLFSFVLLVAGLHLHVVFARLLVLRPRVFGGTDTVLGAESDR